MSFIIIKWNFLVVYFFSVTIECLESQILFFYLVVYGTRAEHGPMEMVRECRLGARLCQQQGIEAGLRQVESL